MSDVVSWLLIVDVKEGKLDDFRALIEEMVRATEQDEPGTLVYEYFLSEDERSVHIYERYADSGAVMAHMGNFGAKFAGGFMAAAEVAGWHVYGEPSDEVRTTLTGLGAHFFGPIDGFAR